jgi:hypothetical protein
MTLILGVNGVRRLDANLYGFQRVHSIADDDPLAGHPFELHRGRHESPSHIFARLALGHIALELEE